MMKILIAHALQRPQAKFGVMLGAVFLAELTLMLVADQLQLVTTGWAGALIDAATLTAVASIIMWPLIIKPLHAALESEHAKAQAILDSAFNAIITIDDHGIIQAQNGVARIMFGVSDQDAIGRNISTIIPPPHREQHDRYLESYRRTGVKHVIGKLQYLDAMRTNGEIFPAELAISEVRAGDKRLFTAIIRDVSERKQADSALRESEARYRSLTEMSSDFYWESDTEHRLTARGSAGKASGVSMFQRGAQIGERRWEIPYLSPDAAGWQAHREVFDVHRPFREFELSRLGADGTERHISISGDPVFDGSGAFKGYRGVGTDIIARKRAESALRESEDRYRDIVENSGDLICPHDLEGKLLSVNAAGVRLTGYSREAL